jgi:hypothetical protein
MKWSHHPTHGFRFSATDALAIIVCAAATLWTQNQIGSIAWIFPFVLGHFFLFCNVFRVPRKPELFWASGFILFSTCCLAADVSVLHAMWLVLPLTFGVLIYSIHLPGYHGIGSVDCSSESQSSPE